MGLGLLLLTYEQLREQGGQGADPRPTKRPPGPCTGDWGWGAGTWDGPDPAWLGGEMWDDVARGTT
jgi:hypothetical protein